MMKKILHILVWLIIIGNLALVGVVAVWLLKDYPTTYVEEPIPILNENKQIAIGEPIEMKLHIHKNNEYASSSSSTILCSDGNLFNLPSKSVNLPKGEYTLVSLSYIMPATATVGTTCTFKFTNNYKINPIRTQTRVWESERFTVVQ